MGRIYTVPFTSVVASADGDVDLWSLLPVDDQPIRIRGFRLGQVTETGDAAEEGLRITVLRLLATVTIGSGGAAGVAEEMTRSGQTPGFTSRTDDGTVATTSGTTETLDQIGWNNRNTPLEIVYWEREFCPAAIQAEALIIRMETTLGDDMTFAGVVFVEEEGG